METLKTSPVFNRSQTHSPDLVLLTQQEYLQFEASAAHGHMLPKWSPEVKTTEWRHFVRPPRSPV